MSYWKTTWFSWNQRKCKNGVDNSIIGKSNNKNKIYLSVSFSLSLCLFRWNEINREKATPKNIKKHHEIWKWFLFDNLFHHNQLSTTTKKKFSLANKRNPFIRYIIIILKTTFNSIQSLQLAVFNSLNNTFKFKWTEKENALYFRQTIFVHFL